MKNMCAFEKLVHFLKKKQNIDVKLSHDAI